MRLRWVLTVWLAYLQMGPGVPVAVAEEVASRPASAPALVVRRVQLVTVSDTSAVLTWETSEPADAEVHYGASRNRLDQVAKPVRPGGDDKPQRFHYCELRGLTPGTRYYYRCRADHTGDSASLLGPSEFTTLVPPPGRELFSFATMTDTHVGQESVATLVIRNKVMHRGVRWHDPGLPFWRLAVGAAIDEINAGPAAFTIVKGDITDRGSPDAVGLARELLGRLRQPCYVVRGNHDRLSPFLRTFGLERSWYSFNHEGVHFVVLDSEPLAEGGADLEPQLAWLADDLREHAGEWVFVFVHRPLNPHLARASGAALSEEVLQMSSGLVGKVYGPGAEGIIKQATGHKPQIAPAHAARLAGMFRSHGRIAGVFAGHLHRNHVGYWPEQTGNMPYVETASTKEYPCGYSMTRVFTGGYMHTYHVSPDPRSLEWSAMSQDAYARLGLQSKAGSVAERNFVVRFGELKLIPSNVRTATQEAQK